MILAIAVLLIFLSGLMIGYVYGQNRSETAVLSHTELDDRMAPYTLSSGNWSVITPGVVTTTSSTGGNVTWRSDDQEPLA